MDDGLSDAARTYLKLGLEPFYLIEDVPEGSTTFSTTIPIGFGDVLRIGGRWTLDVEGEIIKAEVTEILDGIVEWKLIE